MFDIYNSVLGISVDSVMLGLKFKMIVHTLVFEKAHISRHLMIFSVWPNLSFRIKFHEF